MTPAIVLIREFPNTVADYARLTERQRARNIAAEGQPVDLYNPRDAEIIAAYRNYRTALSVLDQPHWYDPQLVRDSQAFVTAYEEEIPVNPGPMPRELCAADQQELHRRRCVEGTNPDRPRPADYGLGAIALGVVLAVLAGAILHAWAVVLP